MEQDQRLSTLITKKVELLQGTSSYRELLLLVATACLTSDNVDAVLGSLSDVILRTIARDLSACSTKTGVIILHLGIVPKSR